jgi:hypothetical protein
LITPTEGEATWEKGALFDGLHRLVVWLLITESGFDFSVASFAVKPAGGSIFEEWRGRRGGEQECSLNTVRWRGFAHRK